MPPKHRVAAYLLAGGASRRMGRCKARLLVDGRPLAVHLARNLAPWVDTVYLVAKPSQSFADLGLPLLVDSMEERALVHGLSTVLGAPGPEWRLVCATDMPDVGPALLQRLWRTAWERGAPGSYPVAYGEVEPEPLPSLWRVPTPPGAWTRWGMAARDWLRAAGLVPCPLRAEEGFMLAHVNEPEQWRDYLERRKGAKT